MIKLVDYFVVVGYDDSDCYDVNKQQQAVNGDLNDVNFIKVTNPNRNKAKGKIIQRFPIGPTLTTNETNTAVGEHQLEEFDANIHCFCQPDKGWRLYTKQEPPTFFVSVLTDIKGQHRYCACLTFLEPYSPAKNKKKTSVKENGARNSLNGHNGYNQCIQMNDTDDSDLKDGDLSNTVYIEYLNDDLTNTNIKTTLLLKQQQDLVKQQPIEPSKLYVAKSLVLISRLECIDLFKSCLSLIYAVYVDKRHSTDNKLLEIIISNLLTIQVNAPGTALATTFSLGADDRHIIQATASLTVPSTGSSVYKLFKEIGVVNVFKLVCAILADFKILFFSRSYTKLYDACRAIESLLFPLKYTGVYVPVLPCFGSFLEFPAAPTPYIIGVHSSFRRLIEEMHSDCLQECLKVDLDGASVWIPQCVDDLIGGNFMNHQSSANSTSSVGTNTTSGISMMTGSSSSAYSESYSPGSTKSGGLPHYLYDSTLNLLYSILKPDVLRADELVEFCLKPSSSSASSVWSMSSGIMSSASTSSLDQQQAQQNDQLLFVSQLNSSTAAQLLVAAAAADFQTTSTSLKTGDIPCVANSTTSSSTSSTSSFNNTNHSIRSSALNLNNNNTPLLPNDQSTSVSSSSSSSLLTTNVNQMSTQEIESVWIDKLLRAVFVRLFAQLFAGYRYCLLVIRINPKPVICFNKAAFLGNHCLTENEFMNRLLDSMSFQRFIEERGPSYRHCDVFDDLYADIQSQLKDELEQQLDPNFNSSKSLVIKHLKQIAEKLYKYEFPQTSVLTSLNVSTSSGNSSNNMTTTNNLTKLLNQQQQKMNKDSTNLKTNSNGLLTTPNRSFSKIKLPTLDAYKRIHSETFPQLDANEIQRLININCSNFNSTSNTNTSSGISDSLSFSSSSSGHNSSSSNLNTPRNHLCRPHLVPYGPPIETVKNMSIINKRLVTLTENNYNLNDFHIQHINLDNNQNLDWNQETTSCARKLEAISQCVLHIFENNFKEAKKNLNSAYRALRDSRARLHLCNCLQKYVKKNQVILNNEQFEYICKLLNESLANDTRLDESGVAFSILPLTSAFYRKLNNGTVDQCIYTRLQQHSVWSNMQFWEMAFYSDVQRSIRPVYLSNEEFAAEQEKENCTTNSSGKNSSRASITDVETGVETGKHLTESNFEKLNIKSPLDDLYDEVESKISKKKPRPDNLNLNLNNQQNNSNSNCKKLKDESHNTKIYLPELNLNLYLRPAEKTALEICGEQMEKYSYLTPESRENFIRNEQGIIRSHVLHYITQMVNMMIPLDINKDEKSKQQSSKLESPTNHSSEPTTPHSQSFNEDYQPSEQANGARKIMSSFNKRHSSMTAASNNNNDNESINENGAQDAENLSISASDVDSGLPNILPGSNMENPTSNGVQVSFKQENIHQHFSYGSDEAGYSVWKFVSKFVDHVCIEGNLNDVQRQSLHHNLSEVISMQIQMLDTVYKESKRIPLRTKPKFDILKPDFMFSGEHFVEPTPLRCHLVPDGREELNGLSGGTVILPAEGALFLTNYRIIYRGFPINDSLMSDAVITRSFPISSLIKEKKIGNQFRIGANTNSMLSNSLTALNNPGSYEMASLHDGIQMRSSTFQLIKVFFDEEVTNDKIEKFRQSLLKLRYPQSVLEFFCFNQTNIKYTYTGIFNPQNNSYMNYPGLSKDTSVNSLGTNNSNLVDYYAPTLNIKTKEKHTDAIRHFAKSTLRKAGLMPRNPNRKLPNSSQAHLSTLASRTPETIRKSIRNNSLNNNFSNFSSIYQTNNISDSATEFQKQSGIQIDTDEENLSIIEENFDSFNGNTINGTNTITPNALLNNLKSLEKWLENSLAYKDYLRQGLISFLNTESNKKANENDDSLQNRNEIDQENEFLNSLISSSSTSSAPFRICTLNTSYQLCKSYPALFIVSKETTDECIRKNAKCHRQNRLPIIVWQHPVNKSLLLRSSGFHGKGFIGMLMKGQNNNNVVNENNTSIEQDKYINQIVKLTRLFNANLFNANENSNTELNINNAALNTSTLNNPLISSFSAYNHYSMTPSANRRSAFTNKIEKAVQSIKTNYNLTTNGNTSNPSVSSLSSSSENGTANNLNQKVALNQIQHHNQQNASKFNTIASLSSSSNSHSTNPALNHFKSKVDFDTNSSSQVDALNESFNNSINSTSNLVKRGAPLYILCEKSQIKSLKSSDLSKDASQISFIPVDIHEVRDAKNSFKKLCKACVPSSISNEINNEIINNNNNSGFSKTNTKSTNNLKYGVNRNSQKSKSSSRFNNSNNSTNGIDHANNSFNSNLNSHQSGIASSSSSNGFYKQLHESKWFEQLQTIINVSNIIVDRLEELSSVIVALEEGWDFTSQVTSLAELFLDPYYRTIEGFSVLIEREWLSMGHRFTRRNNHTADDQTGFAPIFIQFLDIVHQCINQFPNAFEFNEFYLEFLAYHSVSNRFKTFLLDNEFERFNFGLLSVNSSNSNPTKNNDLDQNNLESQSNQCLHTSVSHITANTISPNTTCIWQYIQKVHYNSAKFFNFNYQPNVWNSLRPSSSLYKMKLWRYYTKETLCTGPVYDLDLLTIGNLNYNPANRANTINTNGVRSEVAADEFWYPVPIKNANDYYEQLDQILPSQYEILLKQIMRKYNITSSSGNNLSPQTHLPPSSIASASITSANSSNPTSQLLSSILSNSQLNTNVCNLAAQNVPLNWKNVWDYFYQTVETKIIKEFITNAENTKELNIQTNGSLPNTVKPFSQTSYPNPLQRQLSTPSSSSMIPPPFPTIKQLNHHEFEEFIFSSGYLCCHCGGSFKSTTQFIGLKCKNCTMSFHEDCLHSQNFTNECNYANNIEWNSILSTQPQNFLTSIPQLEISINSMQTTSSCSTSPNSYYSQNLNATNRMKFFNSGKLDTDIGSACATGIYNQSINGYTTNISPNSYGKAVSSKINKSQLANFTPVSNDEENGKNYINWSGISNNEHQTYAGYLKKQGALFKQWKERYFVLDSLKHQLRYYDSTTDSTVKGIIDLSDVEAISQGLSSSYLQQNQQQQQVSTTKKALNTIMSINSNSNVNDTDAKNCFELKTSKRVYYFCAKSQADAYKWIKQLQMCCLDS